MKLLFQTLVCAALAATPATAKSNSGVIDTVLWFQGCAALTQNSGLSVEMDTRCTAIAADYCEMRPREEVSPCFEQLVRTRDQQSQRLLDTLPDGEGVTGFAKRRFERERARLSSPDPDDVADCGELQGLPEGPLTRELCAICQSSIKWTGLRSLHRLAQQNSERTQP